MFPNGAQFPNEVVICTVTPSDIAESSGFVLRGSCRQVILEWNYVIKSYQIVVSGKDDVYLSQLKILMSFRVR